jgi:predicted transcriptional regulator of viral defense system
MLIRNVPEKVTTQEEKLLGLLASRRLVRARDLKEFGIPREYLSRLLKKGLISRVQRGLYELADATLDDQWTTLAEVCRVIPKATICLVSALQFHGLTTQSPHKVWVALPKGTHKPRISPVKLECVYMRKNSLPESSVLRVQRHGDEIRITTRAKTVADSFKFQRRVGRDVAVEALKDYVSSSGNLNELLREAERDRVKGEIVPILEAILST